MEIAENKDKNITITYEKLLEYIIIVPKILIH